MRNENTLTLAEEVNLKFDVLGLDVDAFMAQYEGAYDVTPLHHIDGYAGPDGYAAFHIIVGNQVATIYYWSSRTEWYVKF